MIRVLNLSGKRTEDALSSLLIPMKYMMTGGVSKNKGLVKTLEEKLGTKLVISDKAQLCGALGAALFAADMADV